MTLPRRPRSGSPLALALAPALAASVLVAGCSSGSAGTASGPAAATSAGGPSASASVSPSASPSASSSGGSSASPSPGASSPGGGAGGPASGTAVYARAGAGMLTPVTRAARPLVYVPNTLSNTVDVIDPRTYKIVRSFPVPRHPQHVVPSWDLRTLWVNDNEGNMLTPIDPQTGRPGRSVPVDDPYNLYFSPDGKHALVMAEARKRIDVLDARTMARKRSLKVPCEGVNHADYTADLSTMLVSCEYSGKLLVVPADASRVTKVLDVNRIRTPGATDAHRARHGGGPAVHLVRGATAMPQDVRLAPDGRTFLVADMLRNGVWLVDASTFAVTRFLPTGKGAHGVYPSRDASVLYVSNRDEGSVSVVDAATLRATAKWRIPGGGSPDMGGVTLDGTRLWLSGRGHGEVYVLDTRTGRLVKKIRTGAGPHGLCVWPQPGRFSLGHTGNMR